MLHIMIIIVLLILNFDPTLQNADPFIWNDQAVLAIKSKHNLKGWGSEL